MLGVAGLECQPQQGRHRRQGDVALVPREAETEGSAALMHAHADHAQVGNGGRVGTRIRTGQRKAGNLGAGGQAWQIMVFLFFGAVVQQQFGRPQRIGHHHGHCQRRAAARQLHHHLRVHVGGELLAAILLGNDHAEETLRFHVVPGLARQILCLLRFPVVDQFAQPLDVMLKKMAFLGRERGASIAQQFWPVGLAGKQLGIPPRGARFERVAFRVGHRWQDALEQGQQVRGKQGAAHGAGREQQSQAQQGHHQYDRQHAISPCYMTTG
ncbi:hypothetical protein D3C71_331630 [compost metagenome]